MNDREFMWACPHYGRFLKIDQKQNKELTEEITKLESDRSKILESANTQLIEEKHQLESVMQVQAENDQVKSQQKTENNQLRNQIKAERIQLESHLKEEKLHLESRHQRETNYPI